MTVLVFGGMFGAFMYIEPLLTRVTGFSDSAIPWLLVLFGVGLFAGNMLGGKAADRHLRRTSSPAGRWRSASFWSRSRC